MSQDSAFHPPRRQFLGQLGAAAATLAGSAVVTPLFGERTLESSSGGWDTSWVARLATGQYKVAFDTTVIEDGIALDHAAMILDQFHEVYDTTDDQVRVVMVMRQLGTTMGFSDAIWERYPIAEGEKINDRTTKAPARYNPFWSARSTDYPSEANFKLERLTKRGVIVLVCANATANIARSIARKTQRDPDPVIADFKANLIPGAILVPSGVFAMIRAQNAGCAFMRAS